MLRASALLSLVALLACSSTVGSEEPTASAPVAPGASAIAKIVTRDRSITLSAGRGTVRATVIDDSGRLVAHDVDIDALQTIDATAYDACHASFAGNREHGAPVIPR
jgi:hypothetical protein